MIWLERGSRRVARLGQRSDALGDAPQDGCPNQFHWSRFAKHRRLGRRKGKGKGRLTLQSIDEEAELNHIVLKDGQFVVALSQDITVLKTCRRFESV